ncbi:DNA methyltransferase [Aliiroseovarius zhejiangensis]
MFGHFVSVYASFSHSFAIDALNILATKRSEIVLDPYAGAGTTLGAANELGLPSIGLDLSPFSVALAKLRFSTAPHQNSFDKVLSSRNPNPSLNAFSSETASLFNDSDLALIASLIPKEGMDQQRNWLRSIFSTSESQLDDSAYVLLCAIIAANKSAKVTTGSNPVWIRKLLAGEPSRDTKLEILTNTFAEMLRSLNIRHGAPLPQARLADARSMPIETDSVDIAIFSPPYLNRLDYFVSNYPANMVLCDLSGIDAETTRKEMIGTTKIVSKDVSPYPIGEYCKSLLNEIWNHSSKASKSYYYWNYVDYIRSTYEVSAELRRVMKANGRGAIVIQDSFYKELRVLTHQIVLESLVAHGFRCNVTRRETVKGHMGRMSPRQTKYATEKTLYEYVLEFSYS